MDMRNNDIRKLAKKSGVPLWKVAEKLGVADNTLYRYLRYEMTEEQRAQYINIIKKLSQEDEE